MKDIYDKIKIGKVEYYQSEWNGLSKDALDFTHKMIQKSISKRMTPAEALDHSWIKNKDSHDGEINVKVLKRLANFKSPDKLKKEIYHVLASSVKR